MNLVESLHRSPLFSSLSEIQVQTITQHAVIQRFANKATFQSLDDSVVRFLVSGRAKVCCKSSRGKQPILYFADPEELIGEQSILRSNTSDHLHVEAIEACLVAQLPVAPLRILAQTEASFAYGLMELITTRRLTIEQRIQHTMFLSNRERLIHILVDLAEQYGKKREAPSLPASLELGIKLSHQDLANLIGSTRETVTVVLGKLQQEELLQIRRRQISLCDIDALAKEVGRTPQFQSDDIADSMVG